jgi:2-oxoglutarate dehydrogenase E1 component
MTHPTALVLWEAQFGDFVNGAQVIIDQFLAASTAKWGRTSALVLLLPHGFEGQGPEHSSARLERFLQLCADQNLQVANCSTAAQYFHILWRQGFEVASVESRRPLILFTPKSLLRHPEVACRLEDLYQGQFHPVLADAGAPERVTRVIFCSGKVYYDLSRARKENKDTRTALVRIEQLYPFPEAQLRDLIRRSKSATEWLWVQEEPENMGASTYIRPLLQALLPDCELTLIAREPAASPATGSLRRHQNEQKMLIDQAFSSFHDAAAD